MYRYLIGRHGRTERVERYSRGRWRRRWPRSRAGRWLLWLLILVVVLIVLDQLFGGFQKGTKVGGLPDPMPTTSLSVEKASQAGVDWFGLEG